MRRDLSQLAAREFDLAVVGGGVHGAWSRCGKMPPGLRTALLERDDFGAATRPTACGSCMAGCATCRASTWCACAARCVRSASFARLAPQLVTPLGCLLPLRSPRPARSPLSLWPGVLLINEIVSGGQRRGVVAGVRLPRSGCCRRAMSWRRSPLQQPGDEWPAAAWWDMLLDDAERMTVEVVLAAAAHGACVANRVEACAAGCLRSRHRRAGAGSRRRATVRDQGADGGGCHRALAGRLAAASGLPQQRSCRRAGSALEHRGATAHVAARWPWRADRRQRRRRRELFLVPFQGRPDDRHRLRAGRGPWRHDPGGGLVERFVELVGRVAPQLDLRLADVVNLHWGVLPAAATHGLAAGVVRDRHGRGRRARTAGDS